MKLFRVILWIFAYQSVLAQSEFIALNFFLRLSSPLVSYLDVTVSSSSQSPSAPVLLGWIITISVGPTGYCDGVTVFCNGGSFCSANLCCCPTDTVNNGTQCVPVNNVIQTQSTIQSQASASIVSIPSPTRAAIATETSASPTLPSMKPTVIGPLLTYPPGMQSATVTVPTTSAPSRTSVIVPTLSVAPVFPPVNPVQPRPPMIGDFCAITPQCPTGAFCIRGVCLCATGTVQVGNNCSPAPL